MRPFWPLGLLVTAACIPRHNPDWVHADAVVVDAHAIEEDATTLRQGAVDVRIVWVDAAADLGATAAGIDAVKASLDAADVVRAPADLQRRGRTATLLGIVGDPEPAALRTLHEAGVRAIRPSRREQVAEIDRLGMLIDLAGVPKTFWDILEATQHPVIVSRAGAATLTKHPLNLTDAQMRAVAARGGVVCIAWNVEQLDEASAARVRVLTKIRDEQLAAAPEDRDRIVEAHRKRLRENFDPPPVDVFIDHVMHAVGVAGADHVGIGIGPAEARPNRLASSADLPGVTELLLARGLTREQVMGILGGNLMRVIERVVEP